MTHDPKTAPSGRNARQAAKAVLEMSNERVKLFAERDPDIFRDVARFALRDGEAPYSHPDIAEGLPPLPAADAELVERSKAHYFHGDQSDLRMRFNEAIAGGPNMEGDAGYVIHTNGHAADMEQAIARIKALSRPAVTEEMIAFLMGEGPLEGCHFGERPEGERGNFWWRKRLRAMLAAKEAG